MFESELAHFCEFVQTTDVEDLQRERLTVA